MDDIERLYEHQTMMAVSIYSFLDNLLSALRSRPSSPLTPQISTSMQPGGYAENLFLYLSQKEKDELQCSICYFILRDAHQCQNGHLFCYSCVYVWSHTSGGGHDRCPMCRVDGLYAKNHAVEERINRKRVRCTHEECNWRGYLRDYEAHKHGQYTSTEMDSQSVELPAISQKFTSNISTSDLLRKVNSTAGNTGLPPTQENHSRQIPELVSNMPMGSRTRRPRVTNSQGDQRPVRRSDPASRRQSGPGTDPASTRPNMIPFPPATPRPAHARSVRTGVTITRRASQDTDLANRSPSVVTVDNTVAATPAAGNSEFTARSPQHEITARSTGASRNSNEVGAAADIILPEGRNGETTQVAGLQYRRLAHLQSTRPHPMTDRLTHGRDQLFVLMTLMSYELEERRRAIEQFQTMNAERERVRLQQLSEVQTLNRRLTLVTNNLSRLLDTRVRTLSPLRNGNNSLASQPRVNSNDDSSDSDDSLPQRLM